MPDEKAGARKQSRRTKQLDVFPDGTDQYTFVTALTDKSFGGVYETDVDSVTVHRFVVEGRISGEDLTILELTARAEVHPFPQCPGVTASVNALVGRSLASGWRRTVLDTFGGVADCTHLTTVLLGLSEVTTLVYFQQQNGRVAYGPSARASGEWIAGNLKTTPALLGACHVLDPKGQVIANARRHLD